LDVNNDNLKNQMRSLKMEAEIPGRIRRLKSAGWWPDGSRPPSTGVDATQAFHRTTAGVDVSGGDKDRRRVSERTPGAELQERLQEISLCLGEFAARRAEQSKGGLEPVGRFTITNPAELMDPARWQEEVRTGTGYGMPSVQTPSDRMQLQRGVAGRLLTQAGIEADVRGGLTEDATNLDVATSVVEGLFDEEGVFRVDITGVGQRYVWVSWGAMAETLGGASNPSSGGEIA
jgi:hypothetical protein